MHDPCSQETGVPRLTVTAFTRRIKQAVEDAFGTVAVEGEISNYTHHGSGHRYFTLKDKDCQLGCVMFRWMAQSLDFVPAEGAQVLAIGSPTVYERGGRYQLNVVRLLPLGRGDLLARLEELKEKLREEGVFDNARPTPRYPRTVGVATSPTGAAVRDIITVIRRRAPHVRIILRPTLVQGVDAAADIVRAIADLNDHTDADVIIVGRGGGSIEDLWCFNDEHVARAMHASVIPVISAVGHETDFTIADFAADLRAPTPSAAAESAVPDTAALLDFAAGIETRLRRHVLARLDALSERTESVRKRIAPDRFVQRIMTRGQEVDELTLRLRAGLSEIIAAREKTLERLDGALAAMNPKGVLARGYAIVTAEDGSVVASTAAVGEGDSILVEVSDGSFGARVAGGKRD